MNACRYIRRYQTPVLKQNIQNGLKKNPSSWKQEDLIDDKGEEANPLGEILELCILREIKTEWVVHEPVHWILKKSELISGQQ